MSEGLIKKTLENKAITYVAQDGNVNFMKMKYYIS